MRIFGRWYHKALCFATLIALASVAFAGPTARNFVGLSDTAGNNVTMTSGNVPISGTVSITAAVDPCASMAIAKSFTNVDITVTGETEIVAAVSGKIVYVCGFSLSAGGTAPQVKFMRGTKTTTACDTGYQPLTGSYQATSGALLTSGGFTGAQFQTTASSELCLNIGGTSPVIEGYVSYVQQ